MVVDPPLEIVAGLAGTIVSGAVPGRIPGLGDAAGNVVKQFIEMGFSDKGFDIRDFDVMDLVKDVTTGLGMNHVTKKLGPLTRAIRGRSKYLLVVVVVFIFQKSLIVIKKLN